MPSAFAHSLVAFTFSKFVKAKYYSISLLFWGIFCSSIPDADVIMFKFGYDYSHFLGHRGFFHSLAFCCCLAAFITLGYLLFTKTSIKRGIVIFIFLALCSCSHGLLDTLTSGGLGIALFSPFDDTRYFAPFRPIKVSPIGIEKFFSEWGLKVLISEFKWIGVPCIILIVIQYLANKIFNFSK